MSVVLALDNVSVAIAGRTIVRDVSLSLGAGRLVALLGPNGAGKTTLIKAILGLLPAQGAVTIDGSVLARMDRRERARRIAYLPQGHQVHWPLSARDVVALGRLPHGLADPARMSASDAAAVDSAMERTDTTRFANQPVMTLSGGERARVMLARVLAVDAKVLLADEPTASLDPRHQITVMQQLKAEAGRGVLALVVTHDIALASRMADEIVMMQDGAIVAHGSPADVLTDARMAEVYGVTMLRQTVGSESAVTPWGLA